ncbi:MAG: RdgB/HAM1 family non-canonical purine NTP pyrophosphatase [Oscillospiraceae bacterium]|nr:RdgB/HAM1 family non-canonical purine NTP pyrophosphatase [Oscillospiraceae bacterium]
MNRLILASDNAHKYREFCEILSGTDTLVIKRSEAGCDFDVEENGTSFAENAYIKAKSVTDHTHTPAVSDDSGICVDHLGGGPGIYSARYGAGIAHDDHERMMHLLDEMKDATDRSAHYVCSICCTFPNGDVLTAEDICEGTILYEPVGSGGFGYDPIFRPDGYDRSMAQLTPEEKNSISHRGKALRKFLELYKRYLDAHK